MKKTGREQRKTKKKVFSRMHLQKHKDKMVNSLVSLKAMKNVKEIFNIKVWFQG